MSKMDKGKKMFKIIDSSQAYFWKKNGKRLRRKPARMLKRAESKLLILLRNWLRIWRDSKFESG